MLLLPPAPLPEQVPNSLPWWQGWWGVALVITVLLATQVSSVAAIAVAGLFLVGGGILVHAIPALAHWVEDIVPQGIAGTLLAALANAVVGIVVGALVVAVVTAVKKMRGGDKVEAPH